MFPWIHRSNSTVTGYQISRSLRFRASNTAAASFTFGSTTSRGTWTFSAWVKRGALGSAGPWGIMRGGVDNGSNRTMVSFTASDTLEYFDSTTGVTSNSTRVFRDSGAWGHLLVQNNAGVLTVKWNGDVVTMSSTNAGTSTQIGLSASPFALGRRSLSSEYFDGQLADVYLIVGQALDYTAFTAIDANSGILQPAVYTGTYDANSGHWTFADNSAATAAAIGADSSGKGNNLTPSGISVTAGSTNDSLVDSPTNYGTDTGLGGEVRGNYCKLNPLDMDTVRGNLSAAASDIYSSFSTTNYAGIRGGFGVSSGKWGYECTSYIKAGSGNTWTFGWTKATTLLTGAPLSGSQPIIAAVSSFPFGSGNLAKYSDNTSATTITGAVAAIPDTLQLLLDCDNGKYWIGRGGQYWDASNTLGAFNSSSPTGTFTPGSTYFPYVEVTASSGNTNVSGARVNFGETAFANALPSGFKAICTQNLPTPTIIKPNQYFNAKTYAGNHAVNAITGVGFQPDLVWIKDRGQAYDHCLNDSVRGAQKVLATNQLNAETTATTNFNFTSFDADGFTLGASSSTDNINASGDSLVAWCWKKGATPGFDIVAVPSASAAAVSHSLGVKPEMIITKNRGTGATNWYTTHKSLQANMQDSTMNLANTAANSASAGVWGGEPTTTTFFAGNNIVTTGQSYIAYLFASVPGFSKFGSYVGNASADGPFVNCGFRPRFIMIKRATTAGNNWRIWDTSRSSANLATAVANLYPNTSQVEDTTDGIADILSNGFKLRDTAAALNASGDTYIFAAFAETPFKYSRAR